MIESSDCVFTPKANHIFYPHTHLSLIVGQAQNPSGGDLRGTPMFLSANSFLPMAEISTIASLYITCSASTGVYGFIISEAETVFGRDIIELWESANGNNYIPPSIFLFNLDFRE